MKYFWLFSVLLIFSCGGKPVSDDTLEIYTRAAGLYSGGRFSETAVMLEKSGSFTPALMLRGKAEFFSGNDHSAELLFRKVLKNRPAAAEASLYLARILREQEKRDEAQKILEEILGDDPSDIRALRLGAEMALDKGLAGNAEALAFLDRAAEASSEAALVFLDRARLRWIAGNGQGALEDLQKAKVLISGSGPLIRAVENLESIIRGYTP
jgi:tetratricopeptide (TPR) repeat protein